MVDKPDLADLFSQPDPGKSGNKSIKVPMTTIIRRIHTRFQEIPVSHPIGMEVHARPETESYLHVVMSASRAAEAKIGQTRLARLCCFSQLVSRSLSLRRRIAHRSSANKRVWSADSLSFPDSREFVPSAPPYLLSFEHTFILFNGLHRLRYRRSTTQWLPPFNIDSNTSCFNPQSSLASSPLSLNIQYSSCSKPEAHDVRQP